MICEGAVADYALRAIGEGARLLPRGEISLCQQVVLIGSGLLWNFYFTTIALATGFWIAVILALGKSSANPALRLPAAGVVYLFRGTPLFIQLFFAYELFVLLPKLGVTVSLFGLELSAETRWFTRAWLGALIVLVLNTAAYSAEIFYGALRSVPRGDIDAAKAIGMGPALRFRRIVFPSLLRLAWPAYTNEAIFLFHATTLVFFSSFPTWRQQGDALYYANYFAEQSFNPFISYPIAAVYFALATLVLIGLFGMVERRLNRHLAPSDRRRLRPTLRYLR
ncbi:MAG: ABC transporter permease [Paracoccaceae bacterium]